MRWLARRWKANLGDMDLYISPLSCSFAAHVACLEAELPITLRRVDRTTKRLDDGSDYRAIAALGIVPTLALDDGSLLSEMAAVLQWVADRAPAKHLAPPWGSRERYELVSFIHFISTEIHKKHLWMIFSSKTPQTVKDWAKSDPTAPLERVAAHLAGREFLVGDTFSVADAYLFWALLVAPHGGIALDAWPVLGSYAARLRERASVKTALAIELPMFTREQQLGRESGAAAAVDSPEARKPLPGEQE